MQTWIPNTKLQNGQYIIQKVIGGGGFGETYRAEDREENRLVVIKTLNREQREKTDFDSRQKKFRKEALDLAKCYHPHVVQVYDTFLEDGLWAIVMEHIDGNNLEVYVENYFNEKGFLSEIEALSYIDQIGQALECVHDRGLLHRDIKPSNILLRKTTKEAVLIDFGLAREFQPGKIKSMTATKTEGYAPIEQYERRGSFGYYTDVYALAATLYTLLTVRIPIPSHYRAEDDVTLSPPKKYNSNISYKVNSAILKGMELEPENRPQTVREFREILGLVSSSVVTQLSVLSKPHVVSKPPIINTTNSQERQKEKPNNSEPQPIISSLPSKTETLDILSNTGKKSENLPPTVSKDLQFKSSTGMDYKKLRNYLGREMWKEADEETASLMLGITKRQEEGWLDTKSIDNFSCEDIRIIDHLWIKYSNKKFGFSIQRKIYYTLGRTKNYNQKVWETFGEQVGWRKKERWLYYKDITFDKTAIIGHLPVVFGYDKAWFLLGLGGLSDGMGWVEVFSRLEACKQK